MRTKNPTSANTGAPTTRRRFLEQLGLVGGTSLVMTAIVSRAHPARTVNAVIHPRVAITLGRRGAGSG